MSSKRDVTYRVQASRLDDFVNQIENLFGLQPENTVDPEPYTTRLIFLSYRRDDSADVTGRIYDWLRDYYGKDRVFRDYDSMVPGVDFRTTVEKAVQDCDVMLVIMGDKWDSPEMLQRLHDDNDYVRYEIATALARNIPVIPVWVQSRQQMPPEQQLPADIKMLIYRHRRHVRSNEDFPLHMRELIRRINKFFDSP